MTLRRIAAAALVGTAAALVIDALLQNALNVARLAGRQYLPWWVTGNVVERATWMVAAALLWLAAPAMTSWVETVRGSRSSAVTLATAWRFVGGVMVGAPALWFAAEFLARIARITLTGGWAIEGPVFLDSAIYAGIITAYAPWLAGGLIVVGVARHMPKSDDAT